MTIANQIAIRPFQAADAPDLVEILKLNGQYGYAAIEGEAAMNRVAACDAAIFLVAETPHGPYGFIRAIYDGSRALIHLLSVHPDGQQSGIGQALVDAVRRECAQRGAPSLSVTVTEQSAGFWEKQGFKRLPVFLMLQESITPDAH
ncbi:MAG: GNAT family N-acetyltransferase [Caldilineaceae bacterium]|nr:GNAT family N-acetyltransferase [Caldilineaceae bacterium]